MDLFQIVSETNEEVTEDVSCEDLEDAGAFEILGADEVANKEDDDHTTMATNEEILILDTDLIKSSLIPVCRTDEDLLVEKENVRFDVVAGIRVMLPVVVPVGNVDMSWEFTSTPKVSRNFSFPLIC